MATFYFSGHFSSGVDAEDIINLSEEDKDYIISHWDNLANLMDNELREELHSDIAPCTELEFLSEYLRRSEEDFIFN